MQAGLLRDADGNRPTINKAQLHRSTAVKPPKPVVEQLAGAQTRSRRSRRGGGPSSLNSSPEQRGMTALVARLAWQVAAAAGRPRRALVAALRLLPRGL